MTRPATAEDVDAVTALEADAFGPDAWSRNQVEEELLGERRIAIVASDPGDGLAGYAIALQGDVLDLLRIAVAADHRRQGVAHDLLAALPPGRMLLEVSAANVGALAFYRAEGFSEIDRRERYYRDDSDAIVMERL